MAPPHDAQSAGPDADAVQHPSVAGAIPQPAANATQTVPTKPTAPTPTAAPAQTPPAEAMAEARQLYAQRCSLCHGQGGKGDGVAAVNLRPQPRTFVDAKWQAESRDEDVAMIIVRGGRSVGKSMMMPASGDLADRPEVVRALVAVVRSFAPKAQ